MRWSLLAKVIASGFLFTTAFRFAFGHPEPKSGSLELPAAEVIQRTARPAAPAPPAAPVKAEGASFLSLIEVGPAEIEPAEPARAPSPPPAPAPPAAVGASDSLTRGAQEEADRRARRRQDRQAIRAVAAALYPALRSCSEQQIARNPRLRGRLDLEVTLAAQPGTDRGRLRELTITPQGIFIPLFEGCVRTAMASASYPGPATAVRLSTLYTLNPEEEARPDEESEEAAEEDEAPSEADADEAGGRPR